MYSLGPDDAYLSNWTGSSLAQVMTEWTPVFRRHIGIQFCIKVVVFWITFHWNLIPKAQINNKPATSHCIHQWLSNYAYMRQSASVSVEHPRKSHWLSYIFWQKIGFYFIHSTVLPTNILGFKRCSGIVITVGLVFPKIWALTCFKNNHFVTAGWLQ